MTHRRRLAHTRIRDSVRANHHLTALNHTLNVGIEMPRQQYHLSATIGERHQPPVRHPPNIGAHALVVLVNHHLAPKQLAQQHKRHILQETHAVASDSQIAQIKTIAHQLGKQRGKRAGKPKSLLEIKRIGALANLLHAARRGQINELTIKPLVNQSAVLDVLAHHSRAMHRRRQRRNKQNPWLIRHNQLYTSFISSETRALFIQCYLCCFYRTPHN